MTLEELIMDKKKRIKRKRRLTKDERKRQVRDWCTFYRRNWDIYAVERLKINLKMFQRLVIHLIGVSDIFYLMCSRGLSKTFMAALAAFMAVWRFFMSLRASKILITSMPLATER